MVSELRSDDARVFLVNLPNTAMIFPTSAALIGGLRGSVTNVGVKRMLIQRSDQPACDAPHHQSAHRFSLCHDPTLCQEGKCMAHRNVNHSNSTARAVGPDHQLTQPQAREQQQHARDRGRERDRDVLEQGVDAEAGHEDDEDACRHEDP